METTALNTAVFNAVVSILEFSTHEEHVLQQNEGELVNPTDAHLLKSSNFSLDLETSEYEKLASEKAKEILKKLKTMKKLDKAATLLEVVKTEELPTIIQVFNSVDEKDLKIRDVWDTRLKSILHVAARTREYAVVKYLVTKHGFLNVLSEERFQKHSLVRDCITNIQTIDPAEFEEKCRILQLFFDMKSDLVDSRDTDKYRSTPLHTAIRRDFKNSKQLEFIQFLIQNKANVNAKNAEDRSPLHCIIEAKLTPSKLLDIFKLLTENGGDSDLTSHILNYQTPLHLAAKLTAIEFHGIVQYLATIGRTMSFTAKDFYGNTVLHIAVKNMEPLQETLAMLKYHGADFNAVNDFYFSVLATAIAKGQSASFLNTLLTFGADWRKLGGDKRTVLHHAAHSGNMPALKLFISMGADVNARSRFGDTPLYEALYYGTQLTNDIRHQIVEELLKFGADANIAGYANNLPIALAKERAKNGDLLQCTVDLLEESSRTLKKSSFYWNFWLNL